MESEKQFRRKQVMIVSDSVAMPRPGTPYEDTWVYALKQKYSEFEYVDKSQRGATTETLLVDEDHPRSLLHRYEPDIVVLQLGIVDCAPRCANWIERRFLIGVLPHKIVSRYLELMKKLRTRKPRRALVDPDEFESNVRDFFQKSVELDVNIIVIAIAPAPTHLIDKSPHAPESIEQYNNIYRDLANEFPNINFIDPYTSVIDINDIADEDGIHLNSAGHRHIYQCVREHITAQKVGDN